MNERQRALDLAVTQIEKQFGKGSIMKLGEAGSKFTVDVISTGALGLDIALGIGGVPRGRVVEIYGPESSGKTTLGYHIIAEAQREGGVAAFIDAEHALDPNYARAVGVDVDNLLLSQPDSGEQALEIGETLVRSGAVDVIVVDSVGRSCPGLSSKAKWAMPTSDCRRASCRRRCASSSGRSAARARSSSSSTSSARRSA